MPAATLALACIAAEHPLPQFATRVAPVEPLLVLSKSQVTSEDAKPLERKVAAYVKANKKVCKILLLLLISHKRGGSY